MLDVLCVADLCVDLIVRGEATPRYGQVEQLVDDYAIDLGGSAAIFAGQFARLGGLVGLLGGLGRDPFGEFAAGQLAALGIDTLRVKRRPDLKTGLGLALAKPDGDRATLTYLGAIDATGPEDLTSDLLTVTRHWHVASPFLLLRLAGTWRVWLERCRAAGLTTSLDTNWDPEERWEGIAEMLPLVDLFIPNEAEATAIAGETTADAAGRALSAIGPLVVVKRGELGADVYQAGERIATQAASSGLPFADAVGAGDNFDAGYLRGWLLGWPPDMCLTLARRCAEASLAQPGGFAGQLIEHVATCEP